jgi:CubicO group peptidase (beta-lactamase class C family)
MKKIIILLAFFIFSNFTYSQVDKADFAIKDLMQKHKIVGLQLAIIKNNKIVKSSNYGLSNIEDSIAVDNTTVFSINSMTKAFTGVAIMQLVESGKINLQDPISKYLDSLPNTWRNITIKQITTHTSGIPDIFDSPDHTFSEKNEILFKKIKESPIVFQPGEKLKYNQTNYLLLGLIIEKISGKSFEKFIIDNQFAKVGMNNSIKAGMGDTYTIIDHSARPYSYYINGSLTNIHQPMPSYLYPAGGIYSTATEMAQWLIALQSYKLINAESLKTLWTPIALKNVKKQETNGALYGTAIGFDTNSRAINPVIFQSGGARNTLYIYPEDNVSVVILSNLVGARPQDFIDDIANLYLTEKK